MSELQTAVEAMMNLILFGGAEAAKELFKARVVAGAEEASRVWHGVFGEAPDAYPLADRVARDPANLAQGDELRALVGRVLSEHPELVQGLTMQVRTGDIHAEGGSVAGVFHGSRISIKNTR